MRVRRDLRVASVTWTMVVVLLGGCRPPARAGPEPSPCGWGQADARRAATGCPDVRPPLASIAERHLHYGASSETGYCATGAPARAKLYRREEQGDVLSSGRSG